MTVSKLHLLDLQWLGFDPVSHTAGIEYRHLTLGLRSGFPCRLQL